MAFGLSGLVGIEQLDTLRNELFKISHNRNAYYPITHEQVACWLGHKLLTIISVPANIVEAGICTTGCLASACTLGALKVAIFAITLGNIKPHFSTGCLWLGERACHGFFDIALNIGELVYDAGDLLYQGYRLSRWVAGILHLGNLFHTIFEKLGQVFTFIAERIQQGLDKAVEVEDDLLFEVPYPFSVLNDLTQKHRIDFESNNRSLEDIFKHYILSVANIPLNTIIATGAAGLSIALSTAFVGKVILYATTNINISVSTYAGRTLGVVGATSSNAVVDITHDIADSFVLLYKISHALGITRVVTTALRVVEYIPEAIFS